MTIHFCFADAFARAARLNGLLAALLVSVAALAGPAAAGDPPKVRAAPTDAALISGAGFADGDVGYLVVDLADKRVLAVRNPDRPFIPASVAKIATIAPALEILGGDHRFTTTLAAVGDVANGVLTGSLILRGGGDPSLTGDDLQAMAKQLAGSGIKRVNGSFLYDATAMIEMPQIDAMQPRGGGLQQRHQRTLGQPQPRSPRVADGRCRAVGDSGGVQPETESAARWHRHHVRR